MVKSVTGACLRITSVSPASSHPTDCSTLIIIIIITTTTSIIIINHPALVL
jgi:hypothetical protein